MSRPYLDGRRAVRPPSLNQPIDSFHQGIRIKDRRRSRGIPFSNLRSGIVADESGKASVEDQKAKIENEFLSVLLSAMKKGMTPEEFFAVADATMAHLRGRTPNEIVGRIMNDTASAGDVEKMIASLRKK